jgi:hypothetical protein
LVVTRDGLALLVALCVGAIGSAIWGRWRAQVVRELRAIRTMLETEQEPVLRAIRDRLEADDAPPPDPGRPLED